MKAESLDIDARVIFRAYSEADTGYVTQLMKQLCASYNVEFDQERWEKGLDEKIKKSDHTQMLVAEVEGKVIGMLVADIRRSDVRTGHVANLIVAPAYRKIGVGEQLINNAIEFFKSNHVPVVKVNLRSEVSSARKLFAKLGFKESLVQMKKEI